MQQTSFSNDFASIFTSLEKLATGCCAGKEDGNICTWDLMPKIHKALIEHIEYEEKYFFPLLSPESKQQHKLEHERLLRLLARTSYEFECGYGEQLTFMVRQLIQALDCHLKETKEKAS